jgi:hypothetical protein
VTDRERRIAGILEAAEPVDLEAEPLGSWGDDPFAGRRAEDELAGGGEGEGAESAPDVGGDDPPIPKDWGYKVGRMNERYALVLMGANAVIMEEDPAAPLEERHQVRSIPAFKAWHSNRFTQMVIDGEIKRKTWADRWLTDRRRRQFRGIVFHPAPDDENPAPDGYFNLWRGFAFTPRPGGSYATFADHVWRNIARGRKDYFDWLWGWAAHMLQRPRERIGTAVVLRGGQGWGKTTWGDVLGRLIASHYFLVDDPRYVTGNFNAHMASCLLLQAEEAVWAGDKVAEGRLKGLITSKTQMIEAKGVDPIPVRNYVRIVMTSNNDWVVPAGKDERRYAVFDLADTVAQDTQYFARMYKELEEGGYEALLHDLLAFDLGQVDLRKIPRTDALLEQKIRTLDSPDAWWLYRLKCGLPTAKAEEWPDEIPRERIFADYLEWADLIGVKRRATEAELGAALHKLMPTLRTVRRIQRADGDAASRPRFYVLPPLALARGAFELALGQRIDWEDGDVSVGGGDDPLG